MREIKFRVWDGELMHVVSELIFCKGPKLDGKGIKFYGPGVGQAWIDGENVHLMQYTGLKDKNGTEIYEGDILKLRDDEYYKEVLWTGQGFGYKVIRNDTKSSGYITGHLSKSGLEFYNEISEVVGNIYENGAELS